MTRVILSLRYVVAVHGAAIVCSIERGSLYIAAQNSCFGLLRMLSAVRIALVLRTRPHNASGNRGLSVVQAPARAIL